MKGFYMQDYNFDEHFERYPIAMAYVPWQHLSQIYELDKPFTGRRVVS